MSIENDAALLADLQEAYIANRTIKRCDACDTIAGSSEALRPALESALAGTIGEAKLSAILTHRGYTVGRRAIARHRREAHTP